MNINNNETSINSCSSTLSCPFAPQGVSFETCGSGLDLIFGIITVTVSIPTILLNAFIILAIKQNRDLQKTSNIMLSSMAVTDLLVGVIVMPITAAIYFFTLRQVLPEYICVLFGANNIFAPLLFSTTLHHLTVIAWERYVAVQKWMEYKLIITNDRLKKIAIGTWLSALFPTAAYFSLTVVSGNHIIVNSVFAGWVAAEAVCLFLIAFFYRKVYLGIRNRELNEISQIDVLMKAKLESKVAKTTGLLTIAIISSFIPIFVFAILGNLVPLFRTNASMRLTQLVIQFNSLFNPLLYCYRDHRFRNAIRELLGMKNPQVKQSAVGATHFIGRNVSFMSSEPHMVRKRNQRLTRSVSCIPTDALDAIHGTSSVVTLKKSLSAPTLDTCSSSLDGLDPQQPSSVVQAKTICHVESVKRSKTILKAKKRNYQPPSIVKWSEDQKW